jgi:hypothetical protein
LKIDGFEHAVKLETSDIAVELNEEERYNAYE